MKKILTFAIVALLMGGFAINADAQNRKSAKQTKKEAVSTKKKVATVETTEAGTTKNVVNNKCETLVKDFEQAVDQCVAAYKAKEKSQGAKETNFDKLLAKAEDLKAKIEKSKEDLNKDQADRFAKATAKLMQVYTKG